MGAGHLGTILGGQREKDFVCPSSWFLVFLCSHFPCGVFTLHHFQVLLLCLSRQPLGKPSCVLRKVPPLCSEVQEGGPRACGVWGSGLATAAPIAVAVTEGLSSLWGPGDSGGIRSGGTEEGSPLSKWRGREADGARPIGGPHSHNHICFLL